MTPRLFDLFLGNDQRWRCFSAKPGSDYLIVFPQSWETRGEAQAALTELLNKDGGTVH